MSSQKDFQKTALRVPRDLHKQIHEMADANDRSFNGEILWRLRQSFATTTEPAQKEAQ